MIRVSISSASPVVRAGLAAVVRLDPGLELVDGAAEVTLAAGEDFDGIEGQVVWIAEGAGAEFAARALRAGARAVLPPDASPEEIHAAIRAAAAGLVALRPGDLELPAAAPPSEPVRDLSPREIQILRMMADGMANKTIAWKLGISEHTVKFHVAAILGRLNASSRTEAVTIGIRRGLILI